MLATGSRPIFAARNLVLILLKKIGDAVVFIIIVEVIRPARASGPFDPC
jgi:hypothetical protein